MTSCNSDLETVLIGDSIIEKSHICSGDGGCRNMAVGGYRVRHVVQKPYLDKLKSLEPDHIVLMVGINDLTNGVSASSLIPEYEQMLDELLTIDANLIVHAVVYQGHDRYRFEVNALNTFIASYCDTRGIKFLDLNPILAPQGLLLSKYTIDGTHLAEEANVIWKRVFEDFRLQ